MQTQDVEISNRTLLWWMVEFVRPVRRLAVLAALFLSLWIAAEILLVRQTARTIDEIQALDLFNAPKNESFWLWIRSSDAGASALRTRVGWLAVLTGSVMALAYLREVGNAKLSMNMVYHIRDAAYDRLQWAGFAFHDRYSTGELINRSFSDLQNVRSFLQSAMLLNLEIVLIVVGYLALLATRTVWIAALALAPLPFWIVQVLRFSRRVQPLIRISMANADRNVAKITENIAGVHVVRAFGAEDVEIERYAKSCDEFLGSILARIRMYADFTPRLRGISAASHLSLIGCAGWMILHGKLALGDLLILGSAMGAILSRLQQVSVINDQYQNAIVSARRLHEIMHAAPSVPESPAARPLPTGGGEVEFQGVVFGYDPDRPVLHNLSFRAPAGAIVAIVGPTGAGKSTLVQLIARYYDPQAGRILIDGIDVRDALLADLRRQVAMVFQEAYLFSDPVGANVAYGQPTIAEGRIQDAARLAQAHEFVETLPSGYETILGERGATLSGGQRQRLAIARAIVSDPRILILDDAMAAVDPETEMLIRTGTRHAMRGRTTFVIAHRISTVERADLVLVLEGGRITQMGKHSDLVGQAGHYRSIAEAQWFGESESEGGGCESRRTGSDDEQRQKGLG